MMALIIKDRELQAAHITEGELRLEIAILLYQQGRLSMGKASEFAGMNKILFQQELGKREIPVNYDLEAFKEDMKTLGISQDDSN